MNFDDKDYNNHFEEEELEESYYYRKRHPFYKIIAAIIIVAFLSFSIPQIEILINGKLDFLNNRIIPKDNSELSQAVKAVVSINASNDELFDNQSRLGTGFNISDTGLILTNQHVIENCSSVKIQFQDGQVYYSQGIKNIDNADIALIFIDADNLPFLSLETDIITGSDDIVSVIGNPLGFKQIVLQGPVLGYYHTDYSPVLLLDIDCKPGNSGSPVINAEGKVIGIVYAVSSDQNDDAGTNITLSYPLYYFKDYFKEI